MKYKLYLLSTTLMLMALFCNAQKVNTNKSYRQKAVWIKMMNDTTANYFETVKAFRLYFNDKPLPKEPNEVEGEDAFEKEVGLEENNELKKSKKEIKREQKKANAKLPNYTAEVRAFKSWFYSIKPWVRANGSIIGPAEQQSIIDKQQAELKAIEKANGKN
jgi:hypothetical protein